MSKRKVLLKNGLFTFAVLVAAFIVNLVIQEVFNTQTLIPMIFVLGAFIVSFKTDGYIWGITASVAGVFAVNYAFTFPYYAFDLLTPECLFSAVVMLVVSVITGMLTTKIKEQEKARADSEKEKMRANLLRAVSHDLRTPLTSIYGATSAVIDNYGTFSKEQQLKLLREIKDDSEWLIRMVENLLSVTRIDGEKVQVVKTPTVLEELIDTVLIKFRKRYPDCCIKVIIPDEFISIPMDALLIEQVLINILENSVFHATGMTELLLTVSVKGTKAKFEIEDNGCGIPKDKLGNLFTEYLERTYMPTDNNRNSMGIGLSVCATIIKAHGSQIHAENRKNSGAVFYFILETEE